MQVKELIKEVFKGRASTVVIGVLLFGSSIFSYLSSNNNLELTHRLEVFEGRVGALEEFRSTEESSVGKNEDSILIIETKLDRIEEDIQEIKQDIKLLISE